MQPDQNDSDCDMEASNDYIVRREHRPEGVESALTINRRIEIILAAYYSLEQYNGGEDEEVAPHSEARYDRPGVAYP